MPVFLVIRKSDGVVENAIKWDGESEYDPGTDYDLEAVSGEPGCPWIGWTREHDGSFTKPPVSHWAVVKTIDGLVVQVRTHVGDGQASLEPAAQIEYSLLECPDDVKPGWKYVDGEFTATQSQDQIAEA